MKNLSFWAQSLDNQAPDIIFRDGEELLDDDARQKLVSEIYEIPKSNIKRFSTDSDFTVRCRYPKFVIEAIPTEKDQIDRLAPIVIYGVLPNDWSEIWVQDVCNEIEDFVSSRLKRTLDRSTITAIQDWLNETLKKKKVELERRSTNLIQRFLIQLVGWLKIGVDKLFKTY